MAKEAAAGLPKDAGEKEKLAALNKYLFAERGFHETKIADIAAAADVGVGTFYLHFETKDALFDALVDDTVRRLKAVIDRARAEASDPVDRMRRANAAFCRWLCFAWFLAAVCAV